MAATDTSANNKAGADKKPGADQPADKKAADAAALAKKLYDDSHPAPKPADKPAASAAAAPKPAEAKPAAPEAPKSQGIMGWLSATEKSASAIVSNEASQLKATMNADLKAVNAAATTVLAKGEAAVSTGEAAMAKFGTLSITGLTETAGHIEQNVKHALASKTDGSDKKVSDGSKTNKPSNELAGAANKQAQPDSKAVPAAPADATVAAASAGGFMSSFTGVFGSMTDAVGSAVSYVEDKAKAGLDAVMSKGTQDALLSAATLYGEVSPLGMVGAAGMAIAGAAGAAVLPEMVGMAGTALKNYISDFGNSDFEKSAQHVDSIDNVNFDSLQKNGSPERQTAHDRDDVLLKNMSQWFIAGDNLPGGTASIARNGNEVTAGGKTKDNIEYSVSSTPEKQSAKVGAFDIKHTADGGVTIGNTHYTMTVTPPITTLESDDHNEVIKYDAKTHQTMLLDKTYAYKIGQDKNGTITQKDGRAYVQVAPGSDPEKAMQAAKAAGSKVVFVIDKDGNRAAIGEDGTEYKLYKNTHKLVVIKGNFQLVIDTLSSKAQLFEMDPKTHQYVVTKPDPKTIPKGWVIDGDSVLIDGNLLKKAGDQVLHILGAEFDLKTAKITDPTKTGTVELSADGGSTKLAGAGVPTIVEGTNGATTITPPGKDPIVIDANGITVTNKIDGTVAKIAVNGSAKLIDGKTHQEADLDPMGNERTFNAQHQQIFAMNNQGDMQLADGTKISHLGVVQNTSRNISEPSYNGKSADEVVREASTEAASIGSYVGGGSGMEASLASLESALSMLNSMGDAPGLAEAIGAAKGNIMAKIAEVKNKEYLNSMLSQSGKDSSTIEKAFSMRGAGLSDQDIAERIIKPQDFAA